MGDAFSSTWPGGPMPPGYDPLAAMAPMLGRQPMFGGDIGPRVSGPFNMGTSYDSMINMMLPMILKAISGNSRVPTQFFPEQNVYDQMQAQRYYQASQQAMQMASVRDTQAIERSINGVAQMMTGAPLSNTQLAQNFKIASGVSKFMPVMTQMLGPDLVDQLHGSRGSATVFAQQLHQAMRTGIDPITHTPGYSGESAGRLTQEVFENLFGERADIGAMKGMSAGQAGMLMNEMQARGMLGRPMGLLSVNEQRALLPRTLSEDTVNRVAEQLPEIQQILKSGGIPQQKALEDARARVRTTHQQLQDPTIAMGAQDLEKLPGAQDLIRAGDADRITQKLKNMAGVVKAMRDIFGDMGNPNAPMREILNGLEQLTQNSMGQLSAGQMESLVRQTHNIAKQTGIGMNNLMGLSAENGPLADRLGLNRIFAVNSSNQAALFGAAAGDQLQLGTPVWGSLSREQLTLADSQMRMHAAASPLANQLNASLRMADSGMLQMKPESELAAYISAVRRGDTTYEFGGKDKQIIMPGAHLLDMLQRDAGIDQTTAYAILNDTTGNQEMGNKYNTTEIVRKIQPSETIRKSLRPALGNRLRGIMDETGARKVLEDAGVIKTEEDFRTMSTAIGGAVATDFMAFDPATVNNNAAKQQALGQSFKNQIRAQIKARMPNADDATIDGIVNNVVQQMHGEQGLRNAGVAIHATLNQVASKHPLYKSDTGMYRLLNSKTMDQAAARGRQAELSSLMQSAMSGLGTGSPIQRLMDVMQNAGPNTQLRDVISDAIGSASVDAIAAADPNGPLAQIFGLVQSNNAMDPNDPKQMEQARRNAAIVQAIVNGGAAAEEQLRLLDSDPSNTGNAHLRKQLENASRRGTQSDMLGVLGYQLGADLSSDQINTVRDNGNAATKLLSDDKASAAERADAMNTFLDGSYERGRQLMRDQRSMEIIGSGSTELVQQTMDSSAKLRRMAEEQTKLLGHDVTVADILRGENGVSTDAKNQALKLHSTINTNWEEIARRRGYGILPGAGDDPENKARQAMTESEKAELTAINDFETHNATGDERAVAVLDQLAEVATPTQRQRMLVDVNRKQLLKELANGDRSVGLHRSLLNRKELLEMGLRKGVFGDKTKLSELTDDEEQSAADRLADLDLNEAERTDLERLRKGSANVIKFGDADTKDSDIMSSAISTVKSAATASSMPLPPTQPPEIKVTVTGEVTQKDDGKTQLNLSGMGILEHAWNLLGKAI